MYFHLHWLGNVRLGDLAPTRDRSRVHDYKGRQPGCVDPDVRFRLADSAGGEPHIDEHEASPVACDPAGRRAERSGQSANERPPDKRCLGEVTGGLGGGPGLRKQSQRLVSSPEHRLVGLRGRWALVAVCIAGPLEHSHREFHIAFD